MTDDERITAVEKEIHDIRQDGLSRDSVIASMAAEVSRNTMITERIEGAVEANRVKAEEAVTAVITSNSEMLDFFTSMKGAFRVLNWIGKLAKPLGAIAFFCTSMWGAWLLFKNGAPPK